MSPPNRVNTMPERYDQALHYARDHRLPPDQPRPCFTTDWPPENVELLVRYGRWLVSGGFSEYVIRTIYIPMAGHVLGLALKPHPQLNLDTDLPPALDYVKAKGVGADWLNVSRNALNKFRRFLLHERGHVEVKETPYQINLHTEGLPAWLVEQLERYQHVRQRNWRTARLENSIRRFWSGHLRLWRFLCGQRSVVEISDLKRQYLFDYADFRLSNGYAASGINGDLREFHGFMGFLQDQGWQIPQSLFRIPGLKQPDALPKHLTDEQVRLLRDDFEDRVDQAAGDHRRRDALLDRAGFYLLWQGALRVGEVEELRLEDLDLAGRKLSVRRGKGMKDRTIYLTDTTVRALEAFLAVRGVGPTDHFFLYRNQPLCKDLLRDRIKAAGRRTGVKVTPHQLRHTCATQLLNAGCKVTSLQKFLGHKRLNSTMVYARVHDHTVAGDYYTAMQQVEKRLELLTEDENDSQSVDENQRERLLELADQLAEPELCQTARLELVDQMRCLINGKPSTPDAPPDNENRRKQWEPPPSPAFLGLR